MTTTLEERIALWHRLRSDPDFRPEWLKMMGPRPPEALAAHRSWGDGVGDARTHVIIDVSFAEGRCECRCGTAVWAESNAALEIAWDLHRGIAAEDISQRLLGSAIAERATDSDVTAFLARAADPNYTYEEVGT